MIPYKQSILHDPANGQFGDCWRTCLGSLLHIDPITIPHFGEKGEQWFTSTQAWLAKRGMAFFELPYLEIFPHIEVKGVYHILTGSSPRDPEVRHSVVALDGEVAHDPHPDGSGLAGEKHTWYMGLLVAMNRALPGLPEVPEGYITLQEAKRKYNVHHATILYHAKKHALPRITLPGLYGNPAQVAYTQRDLDNILVFHHNAVPDGYRLLTAILAEYPQHRSKLQKAFTAKELPHVTVTNGNQRSRSAVSIPHVERLLATY
jgi:hypothetical protein